MKSNFKITLAAAALVAAFSVSAAQRDITVTADIDPTVDLTQADGSALPSSVAMQYIPGKGLGAYKESIKLWSNDAAKNLNVSLASAALLTDASGTNSIPLTVTMNGQELTTTATSLDFAKTFPGGIANGSSVMPLVIAQKTPGVITSAGNYSGVVSLVVALAPAAANS